MKYIKNTLNYSVKFKTIKDGKEQSFVFDCFRTYSDTGNVATTGITPIMESDYDYLYANVKVFKDFVDTGKLVNSKKAEANSVASKIDDLAKENEVLKQKLAEKTKEASTGETEELKKAKSDNKAKDLEIASLKKQLEAVKKKGKSEDETEGF